MTGRPRSRGSSRCSTDAKNASASACSTNICSTVLERGERCVEPVDLVRGVVVDETDADRVLGVVELLAQAEREPRVVRPDAEAGVCEPLDRVLGVDAVEVEQE